MKTDPLLDTPGQVKTKTLINMLPVAQEQMKPKHLAEHWVIRRARETLGDLLSDVKV